MAERGILARRREHGRHDAERRIPAIEIDGSEQQVRAYWRGWLDVYGTREKVREVTKVMGYIPADWVFGRHG